MDFPLESSKNVAYKVFCVGGLTGEGGGGEKGGGQREKKERCDNPYWCRTLRSHLRKEGPSKSTVYWSGKGLSRGHRGKNPDMLGFFFKRLSKKKEVEKRLLRLGEKIWTVKRAGGKKQGLWAGLSRDVHWRAG